MLEIIKKSFRKTRIENLSSLKTSLRRCLSTTDLTFINIGAMVGSGIYVMTGITAKEYAGPAIVFSYVIAAVFAVLNAMCFVELAASIPHTGTSYLYVYCSLGELFAFLTGWSTMFNAIAGAAVNARAWSAYVDFLFQGKIVNFTQNHIVHWPSLKPPLTPQPDILACGILLVLVLIVALGVNLSSKVNACIALINVVVLIFTSIVGFIYADLDNWKLVDHGGFFPHGFAGVVGGATACIWAMSGYEQAAVSIEEAKTPKRSLPIATAVSITFVTILYVMTSSAITLVVPYYAIDSEAPLPSAFSNRGITWATYVVLFGPLCGLTTTLLNSLFALIRILYAMSKDGLLFSRLSHVHKCTRIPLWAVLLGAVIITPITCFMDLSDIIGFGIVLVLLQYTLVSISVLVLRYESIAKIPHLYTKQQHRQGVHVPMHQTSIASDNSGLNDYDRALVVSISAQSKPRMKQDQLKRPFKFLSPLLCCPKQQTIPILIVLFICSVSAFVVCFYVLQSYIFQGMVGYICLVIIFALFSVMFVFLMSIQKQNCRQLAIKIPCVPVIPCVCTALSIALLVYNSTVTSWAATAAIMSTGVVFYYTYSVHHSRYCDKEWTGDDECDGVDDVADGYDCDDDNNDDHADDSEVGDLDVNHNNSDNGVGGDVGDAMIHCEDPNIGVANSRDKYGVYNRKT